MVQIRIAGDDDGDTPLHAAAAARASIDIVDALLEGDADVCLTNHEGYRPVDYGRNTAVRNRVSTIRLPDGAELCGDEGETRADQGPDGPDTHEIDDSARLSTDTTQAATSEGTPDSIHHHPQCRPHEDAPWARVGGDERYGDLPALLAFYKENNVILEECWVPVTNHQDCWLYIGIAEEEEGRVWGGSSKVHPGNIVYMGGRVQEWVCPRQRTTDIP